MTLHEFKKRVDALPRSSQMPVLFVGHGSPMNAIEDNAYTAAWRKLGKNLPRPNAILAISAHWLTQGTVVHIAKKPKTIHDFFGFPKALYDITYPCLGAPEFAKEAAGTAKKVRIGEDRAWGIDHGTWVVLHHMYPNADIPVFQMSIDVSRGAQFHYDLGKELAALRERGVLIMGSGNIVHNLGNISWENDATPFDWAIEFDTKTEELLNKGDHQSLIVYEKLGALAALAVPTPDHYWPLLYVLGLQQKNDLLSFPVQGIAQGSISMRAVKVG